MSRLRTCFTQLKQENHVTLVTFVIAGDPGHASSLEILKGLSMAGADVIELDMPFTGPMTDGSVIRLANICALDGGQTLARTLQMVREFRSDDGKTPLVLMGYFNLIHHYDVKHFIAEAKEMGVDGLIVVDLSLERNEDLCHSAQVAGPDFIRLITPITGDQRLSMVLEGGSGFVYYVSVVGVTSTNVATLEHAEETVTRLRRHTDLSIGVGFDIHSAEHAAAVARLADGVVVGSALVDWIAKAHNNARAVKNVLTLCGGLAEGVRSAR